MTEREASQEGESEPEERIDPKLLLWICGVLIGVILLRSFVLEVYVVVGESMDPSLKADEHLLVNKLARPLGMIQRGDILVFRHPDAPNKHLIKRMIAKAGESVRIDAGRVYIKESAESDELPLPELYLSDKARAPGIFEARVTVPEGCVYVMGDNRLNSRDSRAFGAIDQEQIVGEAVLVIWPGRQLRAP